MDREQALKELKAGLIFTDIRCENNKVIAVQGAHNNLIYLVDKGWVKVSKLADDGKDTIIDICGAGEFLCVPTLFLKEEFPVNVTAIGTSKVLAVDKNSFELFLFRYPEIMAMLLIDLGQKIVKMREVMLAANRQTAYGQVLDLLMHFANIFGTDTTNGRVIPFSVTQQDIGDFIGLSRPRVNICLKGLFELGYIQRKGKYYVLPVLPVIPLCNSPLSPETNAFSK